MAEPKTRPTTASVTAYLDALPDAQQRADCRRLVQLMARVTGEKPVMWGPSIVGFGSYRYVYASGRSGDWPLTGFAARAKDLTLYLMDGFDRRRDMLERLGRHKTGKSCLYVKSLADLDLPLLEEMLADSVETMRMRYAASSAAGAGKVSKQPARTRAEKPRPMAKSAAGTKAPRRR